MPYNPAEFNNPYSDEHLERERRLYEANHKPPEERAAICEEFLELLSKGATVTKALAVINGSDAFFGAKSARVGRKTIYMWRKYDEEFRAAWDDAYAQGTERIEQRATEFALEGNASLLSRMLVIRNPVRYNPASRQELSGPDGGPIPVDRVEVVGVDTISESTEPDQSEEDGNSPGSDT
jgi:hypothetical protein